MIDVEKYVFNAVHGAVAPLCAKNGFRSVHTPVPTAFPTVTLFEFKNLIDYGRQTNGEDEEFAEIHYESHVYATTKAKCRSVAATLDSEMRKLNFTRISGDFTPGAENTKVFEFIARYRALVRKDGVLFRTK